MTGVALAINAAAGAPAYSARQFRDALSALMGWDGVPLAGRQGIRPMGGTSATVVTLSGSTITVNLHSGVFTPGWSAVTGSYLVALTAIENATLTPADATNPRKDIVVGRVYDDDESASALRLYRSEYIAGTPGPTPSEPPVPVGAIRLATIDVPRSGNGAPVVTNNYPFTVAAGGILPVRNQAERDAIVNPAPGQVVDRMDLGWLEHYYAGGWRSHRHVISPGTLADISDPLTGQVVWHTGTRGFQYYTGSAWIPAAIDVQVTIGGNTVVTSGSPVPQDGPSATFAAPPSGAISVEIAAAMVNSGATSQSRVSFEVWLGPAGTGTLVYANNINDSIANGGTAAAEFGKSSRVPGLTPGSSYTARALYVVDGGSTGTFARRRIRIRDTAA